jgi:hypothetical protein
LGVSALSEAKCSGILPPLPAVRDDS